MTVQKQGGSGKRRRYTQEFKDNAIKMVIELDKPIATVARDLGMNEGTLGNWVHRYRDENPEESKPLTADERAAWEADRKALAELKMENEFLKKATAFFAKEYS